MDGKLTLDETLVSRIVNEVSANPQLESGLFTDPLLSKPIRLSPLGTPMSPRPGRIKPGEVLNPNGRPKGSKNKVTALKLALEQALREDAADHMRDVLMKAIHMAKNGHPGMIKLLLELHMSKSGDVDDRIADDKITININSMDGKPAINITPTEETSDEDK